MPTVQRAAERAAFKLFLEEQYGGIVSICGFQMYLPDVLERANPLAFHAALEEWRRALREQAAV
jgi:hypothetical protein